MGQVTRIIDVITFSVAQLLGSVMYVRFSQSNKRKMEIHKDPKMTFPYITNGDDYYSLYFYRSHSSTDLIIYLSCPIPLLLDLTSEVYIPGHLQNEKRAIIIRIEPQKKSNFPPKKKKEKKKRICRFAILFLCMGRQKLYSSRSKSYNRIYGEKKCRIFFILNIIKHFMSGPADGPSAQQQLLLTNKYFPCLYNQTDLLTSIESMYV